MKILLNKNIENNNKLIDLIENNCSKFLNKSIYNISVGDFIKVIYRIYEGQKQRIQIYEGIVLKIRKSLFYKTFTLKRTIENIGIEQVFILQSPNILSIRKKDSVSVRKSKLYYLNSLKSKKIGGKRF